MILLARSPAFLGHAIRRTRRRMGLTQSALGAKVCLRQGSISLLEKGHPGARLDTILAVLATLDLELRVAPRSKGPLIADRHNSGITKAQLDACFEKAKSSRKRISDSELFRPHSLLP